MEHFRQTICERHSVQLKTYVDLYQWSINNLSLFWQNIWEFCDIVHSQPFEQVVDEEKTIDSVPEWFRGARLNFAENLLRFRDRRTAILYESELGHDSKSLSYSELYSEVAKVAAALRNSGIKANDVIAAFAGNVPEVVVFMLAAASIGAIFTTVPPDFGVTAVCDRLIQTSPRIVLASPSVYYNGKIHCQMDKINQMASQVSSIERIVLLNDNTKDGKFMGYLIFIEPFVDFAVDTLSFAQLPFNHPLYILYSSGTTGKPKCLVHSAGGTLIQHLKEHSLHGDLARSDVFLQYTNIGWMMWHWMVSVLALGSTIVLYEGSPFRPDTLQLWRLIEKHRVTRFGTSAKYIQHLQECGVEAKSENGGKSTCDETGKNGETSENETTATTHTTAANIGSFDISSLQTIYSTGSPLSPSDFRFVHDKIKADLQISSITGGTDIISLFGAGNPMLPVHAGEIQCPGLGMAIKAYSETGEEVFETPGDLVCTRPFPSMPVAFWNDSDGALYQNSYFAHFPHCWHHGDFVKFTKNGGLIMLGRSDSTLNPAGVRFGSAELYNVVARFPVVKDSLVVGIRKPDENDERVVMFLQTDSGIVSEELAMQIKKHIRSLLSARHVPALILATPAIPYTLNGKKVEVAVKRILSGTPDVTTVGLANPECLAFYRALSLTTHIDLSWHVDFTTSRINGLATLSLERIGLGDQLILDCSHLEISKVTEAVGRFDIALKHHHNPSASPFGGALVITLPEERDTYTIKIKYDTTQKSSALQWLTPEQTLGKVHPYLFSQCQAIHARTMLPCQDTPSIKATYSASVSVPKSLNVVMSANRRQHCPLRSHTLHAFDFDQTTPIPSYLIAIAVGDIHSKEIGPRSAVWSEAANLDAAAEEFSETESFIATAESLVGPYVWERYDILVLPPSFPYGGMENPCLTFVTPTIIARDKSLVDVIAHEISHSWTGNLVSCASCEHFWLNEGFTMFLERKILARLHGEAERQLHSLIGLSSLKEDLELLKNGPLTKLVPDLSATDPDDAFSLVPYEKGYIFLYTLEELVGIEKFEAYLKAHIQTFAGQSINTNQFKAFILDYFKEDSIHRQLVEFPWDEWLYGTGIGPSTPSFSEELAIPCRQLAKSWIETGTANEIEFGSFGVWQKIMLLDNLLDTEHAIPVETINKLAGEYNLPSCTNVEILLKWYQLCIKSRAEQFYEAAAQYAVAHGRMKYNRPIYRALYQSGPVGKDLAIETFKKHWKAYHPIAVQMIAKDLGLQFNTSGH